MLKKSRFPLLYVLEFGLWLPLLTGFWGTVAFVAASPIDKLELKGKLLPSDWEAAVLGHGTYLRGYQISRHPLVFATMLVLLSGSALLLHRVKKAQDWQRRSSIGRQAKAHVLASLAVMAGLVALCFMIYASRFFDGVVPA